MGELEKWEQSAIVWEHTTDGEFPYRAHVEGHALIMRINDFPDEPLYTLFVDGEKVEDMEDWPSAWFRPAMPKGLLNRIVKGNRQGDLSG